MAANLTDIEQKILDFMVQYLRSNTYQPSIREIGEQFGIKSTKTVSEHLQALAAKGFLERDSSRSRGVRILDVDLRTDVASIPCYRELPADPTALRERAEMHLSLDRRLGGVRGAFIVRAKGDELAVLGVQDRDFVLIEPVAPEGLADGDVVAARLGRGSDFHRVCRNGHGLSLRALASGSDEATVEDVASLPLLGRVSALFRRLDGESIQVHLTAH